MFLENINICAYYVVIVFKITKLYIYITMNATK